MPPQYKPWTYANRQMVRERQSKDFRTNTDVYVRDANRPDEDDDDNPFDRLRSTYNKGTSALSKVADAAGDLGKGAMGAGKDIAVAAFNPAMQALNAAQQYGGKQAFAVASGQLQADQRVDPKTGQTYRDAPGFGDMFGSWRQALTSNPLDTYREAGQAFDERVRNPELSAGERTALNVASDPLMIVPVGAAGRLATRLPAGSVRTALTAQRSPIGALLEGPGSAAAVGGMIAGSEVADRAGLPEWTGALAGGVVGGLSARALTARGRHPVMAATESTNPEGLVMRESFEDLPHGQIKERPELFQGRKADPGKTYGESKVQQIVDNYDPMQMEPGLAAYDASTGDYVVIRGHHRLEAQKRLSEMGLVGESGSWQVVDADLSDPAHVKRLRRLALQSNYGTAKTDLAEDLVLARDVLENGGDVGEVKSAGRFSSTYAADLAYLATVPQDMIDEVVRRGARYENLAEIARVARIADMSETDIRTLAGRYVFGQSSGINRSALREALDETSQIVARAKENKAIAAQGTMFGEDAFAGVELTESILDQVDTLAEAHRMLAKAKRDHATTVKMLESLPDDPVVRRASEEVKVALDEHMVLLEERMVGTRGRIEDESFGRVQTGDGGVRPESATGDAEPANRGGAGTEAQPVAADVPGVGPQRNMFGEVEAFPEPRVDLEIDPENPQAGLALEGGSKGFKVAMNEPNFLETAAVRGQGVSDAGGFPEPPRQDVAATVPEAPAPVPTEAPRPASTLEYLQPSQRLLPAHLADAKPRYSFGQKQFTLSFDSDIDRALYIVAQAKKSKAHDSYVAWLENVFPGLRESEFRRMGQGVRDRIKNIVRDKPAGDARIPEGAYTRPVTKPENPVPTGGDKTAAALGAPPRQMDGTPPDGPPPAEPPIRGRGQNQPFGSEDRPLTDILDSAETGVLKRKAASPGKVSETWRSLKEHLGRITEPVVREKVDPVIEGARRQKQRVNHWIEARLDLERAQMRLNGLELREVDDGTYHLFADGRDLGLAEDIVERTSEQGRAAFAALTPEQQRVFDTVAETNRQLNETMQYHGADVRIDDGIEGEYWGRVALGRQYENLMGETTERMSDSARTRPASRSVGANRIKSRTMESIEEGLKDGVKYDNPWDARAVRLKGKALTAQDAWLKNELAPLAKTGSELDSTLGRATVHGHPAFNEHWFDPAVAERIQRGLETNKGGVLEGFARSVNNVLTPLRASFDLSATFQQGLRAWMTDPKAAAQYWYGVMRSLADDKVYDGMLAKLDADGPGLDYLTSKAGLRYVGDSAEGEFLFSRGALNRIGKAGPAGKGVNKAFTKSNQAFARTLNAYRIHFANSQYKRLAASGLEGAELDDAMRMAGAGVNRAFGWTAAKPTTLEEVGLFAPRYTRASVETVLKAISEGGIEGSMARQHMALMLAEGAALVWLVNEARGYETEFDPRDPNFLRIRNAGGLDVSPFGTYNTLFRAIAQTAMGDTFSRENKPNPAALWKVVEGKMSPAIKLVYEPFIKQADYQGRPIDVLGDPIGAGLGQLRSSLPFGAQAAMEEGPLAAAVQSFGLSSNPLTPAERRNFRRDELAQEAFGMKYEDLSGADKSRINEDERVAKYQAEVDENTLAREDDRSRSVQARTDHARKVDELSMALQRGEITGTEWREQYRMLNAELRGAMEYLDLPDNDKTLRGWFELTDQAQMPDGRIDFDMLEELQANYAAENPGVEEKVDQVTGVRDNDTLRRYREARLLADEYYSIPAYRGMSVEDSRKASAIMQAANTMVSYGYARDRQHALRLLAGSDPEGVKLAQMASQRGPNPARERWRKNPKNRLFVEFYGDATVPVLESAAG